MGLTTTISIFVNPTQFGPGDDFLRYPRPLERDLDLCQSAGVEAVLIPSVEEMYGNPSATVRIDGVSSGYEGDARPGHFEGVATVVTKLFLITQPSHVFFGWKDLQQCAVIANLIDSLKFPILMHRVETVREEDGLAFSSRNAYLSKGDRSRAGHFPRILSQLARRLSTASVDGAEVEKSISDSKAELARYVDEVHYLEIIDPSKMVATRSLSKARVCSTVKIGGVRLLDNWPVV